MSTTIHGVEIRPNGQPVGAEVHNLDAAQPLAPELVLALKQAHRTYGILIFKQQDLSEPQFKAFATYFGAVFQNPAEVPVLASGPAGVAPDIVRVSNIDGYTGTGELPPHADHQWTPYPSAGSFLYALEVPDQGGETSFYNLYSAYEALDEQTKREIDGLQLTTYNPFLREEGAARPTYRDPSLPLISPVFPHPDDASLHYGKLRAVLEKAGTMIGANDLWIASHALALGCVMITDNVSEFQRVPKLVVENWLRAT
jgi:taurine dioxygenase